MSNAFLAVDWGTTNRRVYRIDAATGAVEETERDDRGILAVPAEGFADEAAQIRARFGDLPMLCAGMVGSNRGWREIPYLPCPADLPTLAAATRWMEDGRTAIVPGISLSQAGRSDVMRGEEVQFFGAVASGMTPADALLCQPGTHCKWARMEEGRLVNFTTAMTGEIFALLKNHSLLASQLGGTVTLDDAFREGLADAARPDLLAQLFAVRAAMLLGQRPLEASASYVSGLLIGSDARARVKAGEEVYLLSDANLGALYSAAIAAAGGTAHLVDSHDAFLAGITALWRTLA